MHRDLLPPVVAVEIGTLSRKAVKIPRTLCDTENRCVVTPPARQHFEVHSIAAVLRGSYPRNQARDAKKWELSVSCAKLPVHEPSEIRPFLFTQDPSMEDGCVCHCKVQALGRRFIHSLTSAAPASDSTQPSPSSRRPVTNVERRKIQQSEGARLRSWVRASRASKVNYTSEEHERYDACFYMCTSPISITSRRTDKTLQTSR